MLLGSTDWKLTDRIVNVVRERSSPTKSTMWNGQFTGNGVATGRGEHYLSVLNYPNTVQLTPGFSTLLTGVVNQIGQWVTRAGTSLGNIADGNSDLEVSLTGFPGSISLTELLPGDFNDSASVDAADYAMWRKGGGVLSGFLSSNDVWRSNFGDVLAASDARIAQGTVPEPSAVVMIIASMGLLLTTRRARAR